jgi:hypothetical protein
VHRVRAQVLQDIDAADLVTCISILQRIVPKLERP